jgi:hypothetical protein
MRRDVLCRNDRTYGLHDVTTTIEAMNLHAFELMEFSCAMQMHYITILMQGN